jgi:hypothetical protein
MMLVTAGLVQGINGTTHLCDHKKGIYKLKEPFQYQGRQPILVGFMIEDGSILDSTFCELC